MPPRVSFPTLQHYILAIEEMELDELVQLEAAAAVVAGAGADEESRSEVSNTKF